MVRVPSDTRLVVWSGAASPMTPPPPGNSPRMLHVVIMASKQQASSALRGEQAPRLDDGEGQARGHQVRLTWYSGTTVVQQYISGTSSETKTAVRHVACELLTVHQQFAERCIG